MKKLALILLVFLCLLSSNSAQADEGIGLSPAIKELTLSEGSQTAGFDLDLFNKTSAAVVLQVSFLDFGSLNESGGLAFIGRSGQESISYGLKNWMSVDKPELVIEPGKSDRVKITITNDQNLSPGGHYGAVVVSPKNTQSPSEDNVSVLPAASTLVLLKKQGGENPKLDLASQTASSSPIRLPKSVELKFDNTGNIHLVPRGTVELISPSGKVISRQAVNESSAYILPGSKRNYAVNLNVNNQSPWLPGRYKLVTTWRHDGSDQTSTTTTYHWYIGKFVLWLIVVIAGFAAIFAYIRYRRRPATRN